MADRYISGNLCLCDSLPYGADYPSFGVSVSQNHDTDITKPIFQVSSVFEISKESQCVKFLSRVPKIRVIEKTYKVVGK
jgi:hypothetical protein